MSTPRRPQQPRESPYLRSTPSFRLIAVSILYDSDFPACFSVLLTNCQLYLGLTLRSRRESPRDIGSPSAGPPSRPSQRLSKHRIASTEILGKKTDRKVCLGVGRERLEGGGGGADGFVVVVDVSKRTSPTELGFGGCQRQWLLPGGQA